MYHKKITVTVTITNTTIFLPDNIPATAASARSTARYFLFIPAAIRSKAANINNNGTANIKKRKNAPSFSSDIDPEAAPTAYMAAQDNAPANKKTKTKSPAFRNLSLFFNMFIGLFFIRANKSSTARESKASRQKTTAFQW
jgi:hypothetical protein